MSSIAPQLVSGGINLGPNVNTSCEERHSSTTPACYGDSMVMEEHKWSYQFLKLHQKKRKKRPVRNVRGKGLQDGMIIEYTHRLKKSEQKFEPGKKYESKNFSREPTGYITGQSLIGKGEQRKG